MITQIFIRRKSVAQNYVVFEHTYTYLAEKIDYHQMPDQKVAY